MLGPFSPPAWQDRDLRVAAQAKRDPKQAPVNRHAVLRSVGVATRCDGHSPAAEIDLRSPCKRDGATAPLARLSPDRPRPLPPAPRSDLRPHTADSRASAPCLYHVCCFPRKHQQLCSEAEGSSHRLCRVDCRRLQRLEPIVANWITSGLIVDASPRRTDRYYSARTTPECHASGWAVFSSALWLIRHDRATPVIWISPLEKVSGEFHPSDHPEYLNSCTAVTDRSAGMRRSPRLLRRLTTAPFPGHGQIGERASARRR